jgi:hypothetical protein
MAKLIEFYFRDLFPKKVPAVPCERHGEVIEFPKDKPTGASQTEKIRERPEGDQVAAPCPGCGGVG